MTTLVSQSLGDLKIKRDAPPWVTTATRANPATVWKQLREELPRTLEDDALLPSERSERFPTFDSAMTKINALLPGTADPQDFSSTDDAERLQILILLLDAFAHGDYPARDNTLRELWWWIWNESERLTADRLQSDDPLARLLRAEAQLASGIFFTGFSGMRTRAKTGRKQLWDEIALRTDTDGTPAAELLDIMSAWLASLARTHAWAVAGGMRWGKPRELDVYDGLLRSVATMLRPDGTCCGTESGAAATWLIAAGRSLGWKKADPVMRFASRLTDVGKTSNSKPKRRDTRSATTQSEWAKVMAARSGWDAGADLVMSRHDGIIPVLEWRVGGQAVIAGEWGLEISVNGTPVELTADWDAVSWFEDREVIYLELQLSGMADPVICRQLLFTRDDQQLWLADSVSTPSRPESEIEVTSRFPVVNGWEFERRPPTRELRMKGTHGGAIRCVPLSFPMEATQEGPGLIRADDEFLVRQTGRGGVYCPFLFDWHLPRRRAAVDWRKLTVTEDGRRLGDAEAVAARVRIGPEQWLIYRNLNGSTAMRAVIGYHHNQESVIGRFTRDGEVDPLVLVETDDESQESIKTP